jgi:hypothetical protein
MDASSAHCSPLVRYLTMPFLINRFGLRARLAFADGALARLLNTVRSATNCNAAISIWSWLVRNVMRQFFRVSYSAARPMDWRWKIIGTRHRP